MIFYITFRQFDVLEDFWVEVLTDSYEHAKRIAHFMFDDRHANVWKEKDFNRIKECYIKGKFGEML